jgi:acetyl esterase/lipase
MRARRAGPDRQLSYGPGREQVADLWLPAGPGPFRVVVSLHGGYFQAGYRRDLHDPMARLLTERGLAVLNPEYRRAGAGGSFRETTADVMAAVTLLDSLSAVEAVPVLPGTAVVGHSAGGYLALWAARHPDVELVVALAAVSDLVGIVHGGYDSGSVATCMGASPESDPVGYAAADLAAALPTGTRTVLVHGSADRTVPPGQSVRYCTLARAAGDPCDLVLLDDEGHFSLIEPGTAAFCSWLAVVADWAGG